MSEPIKTERPCGYYFVSPNDSTKFRPAYYGGKQNGWELTGNPIRYSDEDFEIDERQIVYSPVPDSVQEAAREYSNKFDPRCSSQWLKNDMIAMLADRLRRLSEGKPIRDLDEVLGAADRFISSEALKPLPRNPLPEV